MSDQILESYVDEHGNTHYRISQKNTVLTQEQTREVIEKVDLMRRVCVRMHEHIKQTCDVCDEYYCSSWDEDNECCVFDTMLREVLGVKVNG